MKNEYSEAFKVWNIGKEVEFSFLGEDEVVIGNLQVMEIRDKFANMRENTSRVESDDVSN